jgi:hypothetical protein
MQPEVLFIFYSNFWCETENREKAEKLGVKLRKSPSISRNLRNNVRPPSLVVFQHGSAGKKDTEKV